MNAHTINYNNAPAASDALGTLPPLRRLLGALGLGLAVSQSAGAGVSADNKRDVVAEPGLQVAHEGAVFAAERLLQVDEVGLQGAQDVRVAGSGREGDDHGLLFNERERLRVDGVEGGVRRSGEPVNVVISFLWHLFQIGQRLLT